VIRKRYTQIVEIIPRQWLSAIAIILATVCWGSGTVITKGVLDDVPPFSLLVIQLTASTIFLWGITGRQPIERNRRTFLMGAAGLLNPGLAYMFGLMGLSITTASTSSLIWATEPVLILGMAWLIMHEELPPALLLPSSVAVLGTFIILGDEFNAGAFAGNVLIFIAVLCCASYTIIVRNMAVDMPPLLITAWQQSFSLGLAIIVWMASVAVKGRTGISGLSSEVWLRAIVSGIVYYGLAFWFYITGLQKLSASMAGVLLTLIPVSGIAGAYLFLDERLTLLQWMGSLLIPGAVTFIMRKNKPDYIPIPETVTT